MTVLYVILLAVVQGILEFLPVSSFGHLSILQNILGMEHETGVLLEAMLHFGTLAAVILTFWKDISRLVLESLDMLMDTIGNLSLYIHNKRTGDKLRYAKIISNTYKKFALLLLVSMIPTALLGYTARRLVVLAASSQLLPGAGILITGIVLLVVDLGRMGGKKAARDASFGNAMWIGICQGLSVFPGLSRSGLTISAGLMSGFTRSFAVKYSYILSVPAIIGKTDRGAGTVPCAWNERGSGIYLCTGNDYFRSCGILYHPCSAQICKQGKIPLFCILLFYCGLCCSDR